MIVQRENLNEHHFGPLNAEDNLFSQMLNEGSYYVILHQLLDITSFPGLKQRSYLIEPISKSR